MAVVIGFRNPFGHMTNPVWIRWLNRLSDLLFVHARVVNASEGVTDVKWEPRR